MTGEQVIRRPVEEVFDFLADVRNEPRNNPIMRRAEKVTDGPIGVGTRFTETTRSLGRDVQAEIELTAYDRPRQLGLSIRMPATAITGTIHFAGVPGGTRARWTWDVTPLGVLRPFTPLIARIGQPREERIWARLKAYLETPTDRASSTRSQHQLNLGLM